MKMEPLIDIGHKLNVQRMAWPRMRHVLRDVYPKHFEHLREKEMKVLEIGCVPRHCASIRMWAEYFPNSQIFGLDKASRISRFKDTTGRITLIRGEQQDPKVLAEVVQVSGGVLDIVIDDGSHWPEHQIASFETLFPILSPGGIYAVEDIETSLWESRNGGFNVPGSFIEYTKERLDDLAMSQSQGEYERKVKFPISSMTLGANVFFFEKER
jgi:hypothetical protein